MKEEVGINKLLRNNIGLTLVELILTLALMTIVLSLIYNIFFTGNKLFNISKAQTFIQSDVRFAADYITKELKNAIIICDNVDLVKEKNIYYALVLEGNDGSKHLLKKTYSKSNNATSVTEITVGNTLSDLKFSPSSNGSLLSIIVSGKDKKQDYSLEFEIMLNNIDHVNIPEGTNKIYYLTP